MMSGRLEVQGIVSAATGLPVVQFRQVEEDGTVSSGWQSDVTEAREHAHNVLEAAINATYDAAIISFAKETFSEDWERFVDMVLPNIRRHRADTWGLPDNPEDWRPKNE